MAYSTTNPSIDKQRRFSSWRTHGALLAAVLSWPMQLYAADFWWAGDLSDSWTQVSQSNSNWSLDPNQIVEAGNPPLSSDTARLGTLGAARNNINFGFDQFVHGLRVDPGSPDYTLNSVERLVVGPAGVINDSSSKLTLNCRLTSEQIGQPIILNLSGGGPVELTRSFLTLGGLTKNGPGTFSFSTSASNVIIGPTVINGGTLETGPTGTFDQGSSITINSGGTLRLRFSRLWSFPGNLSVETSSSITVNAGGTVASANTFNSIENLNLAGGTVACAGGESALEPAFALKGTVTVSGSTPSQIIATGGSNNLINLGYAYGGGPPTTTFNVADVTANASPDLTIQVPLQNGTGTVVNNPSGLIKTGLGTLLLTAANTYTGGTTISAGTLQIGNGGTSGSVAGNITNNATLVFNRSDNLTFLGVISGTGSLTKAGPGTLTLSTANTYTGGTTISAGTLQIGSGGTSGSVAGNITNNATLVFNRSDNLTFPGVISGTGSLTKAGPGTLTLSAANTYTGPTTVTGGTLDIAGAGTIASASTVTVQSGATLRLSKNDTWGGNLTTTSSPIILQAGSTLASNNTFNSLVNLTVNGGTLLANGGNSVPYPAFYLRGTVTVGGSSPSQFVAGSGSFNVISIGTPQGPSSTTFDVADVTASPATDLTIALPLKDTVFVAGSGQSGLTKAGPGTLTLAAANTYTGPTNINGGTLDLAAASAISLASSISINSGGTLSFSRNDIWGGSATTTSAQITVNTGGTLASNGRYNAIVSPVLAGGTVLVNGGFSSLFPAFAFKGTVNVTGSNPSVIALGTGTNNAIAIGVTASPGVTTFNVPDVTSDPNPDLTINVPLQGISNPDFSGAQPSGLTKTGPGTLLLTAANTFTGPSTISAGTLQIGNGGTTGSVTAAITNHGSLVFNRADDVSHAHLISGTGNLIKLGAGTLTLISDNTYEGANFIRAGTLRFGNGGPQGSFNSFIPTTVDAGATLAFNRSVGFTYFGTISGAGGVTQLGPGNLGLAAANTYTGPTTVLGGTLTFTNATLPLSPLILQAGAVQFTNQQGPLTTFTLTSAVQTGGSATVVEGFGTLLSVNATAGPGASYELHAGSLSTGARTFFVGRTGTGTFAQSGGTVSGGSLSLGTDPTSTGRYLLSGGTANFNEVTVGGFGIGEVVQSGGNLGVSILTIGGFPAVSSVYNLNGGTLTASSINPTSPSGILNLNGGTLAFSFDNSNYSPALSSARVGPGGAVFDTGSFNVTIAAQLLSNSATGGLTKLGTGTLTLTGNSTYTGPTLISAGTLRIGNGGATGSIVGPITNNAALVFNRANDFTLPGLITGTGTLTKLGAGTLTLAAGQAAPYQFSALTISAGAINTSDNDLIINYTGTSPLATLNGYAAANQLFASSDFGGIPTLMVLFEAASLGLTEFDGIPVDATTVIGKFTFAGDANLDGQVDAFDYSAIDDNFGNPGSFLTGDLNLDGFVDALDYSNIDDTFGAGVNNPLRPSGYAMSASSEVFIPEPASLTLLALAGGFLSRRRR